MEKPDMFMNLQGLLEQVKSVVLRVTSVARAGASSLRMNPGCGQGGATPLR